MGSYMYGSRVSLEQLEQENRDEAGSSILLLHDVTQAWIMDACVPALTNAVHPLWHQQSTLAICLIFDRLRAPRHQGMPSTHF